MRSYFIAVLAFVLVSATVVFNIFSDLELSEDKAKGIIIESFGRGLINSPYEIKNKAKSLSPEEQAEGARQLIRFAKEYSKTEDFKKSYTKWRNEELGYRPKKGIGNPFKMIDKAVDKQLNKGDDEKRMPADPNELIKKRLQEFLDISATVDFDAELNGSQFAKPSYEAKSSQWKMCFRAGRHAVQAAREEAQTWLKELE